MLSERKPNPYAEQLLAGHQGLRFEPALEGPFRAWYRQQNRRRIDLSVLSAVLLFTLFALKDYAVLPADLAAITAGTRLWLIVPAMSVIYAVIREREDEWAEYGLMIGAAIALYGLTGAFLAVRDVPGALPYEGLLLVTIFIFFMLGLRLATSALVSMPLLVVFPLAEVAMGVNVGVAAVEWFYLLAANVIGAVGAWTLESVSRQAYLATHSAQYSANHDALTGLMNRKAVLDQLDRAWRQSQRDGRELAVYLVDVDHFKRFNDTYGHVAGDEALSRVAAALEDSMSRPLDRVGRYGGEEFVALAYGVSGPDAAVAIADRMRRAVEALGIPNQRSEAGVVTVTVGLAMGTAAAGYADLVVQADLALYEAKAGGRNRTGFRLIEAGSGPGEPGEPDPELPEYSGSAVS